MNESILQVLLEQRALPAQSRFVSRGWCKAVDGRQTHVRVHSVEEDGSLMRFLQKLPKLHCVSLNKSFRKGIRSADLDNEEPSPAKRRGGGSRGAQEAALAEEKAKRGTLREQERENLRVVFESLRHCSPACIELPFCRFSAADLDALLRGASEGSGARLEALDISGNFFGAAGTDALTKFIATSFPNITSLDISSNDLNVAGIDALADAPALCASLRALKIGQNGIDGGAAEAMGRLLRACTALTELDIDHADLKRGCGPFFESLAAPPGLRTLRLRDASLEHEGGALLSPLLRTTTALTHLALPKNQLNHVAAAALVEALLANPRCEVKHLDLSRNNVGPMGAAAIASLFSSQSFVPIALLDLSENQIRADGCLELAETLRGGGGRILESLTLHSNSIGPVGATAIAGALDGGAQHGGLRRLDVSNNAIDAGITQLCASMARCTQLRSLNVSHNRMGAKGVEALGDALLSCPCAWSAEGHGVECTMALCEIDLSYSNVGKGEGRWLRALAGTCPALYKLELAYNSLGDAAATLISECIREGQLKALRRLGLRGNCITSEGGSALASAFRMNTLLCFRMECIDLRDNHFSPMPDMGEDDADCEARAVVKIMCEGGWGGLGIRQVLA